jgi:hypothetical protein
VQNAWQNTIPSNFFFNSKHKYIQMMTPWRGISILKIHDRAEIRDDTGHIQERDHPTR